MTRVRVLSPQRLREWLARSERTVPHNVRSLAAQVEVSTPLVGHLLTGKRETVDTEVAKRISEELKAPFEELFAPIELPSGNTNSESEAAEP
ncbi:MAG TPA: hypothetical protein VN714_14860 [Trebonia sp.]|nr:hypothetical protein [Trebonia sp.]